MVVKPEDGWPILDDWAALAKDIFVNNYESHRESVELKIKNQSLNHGDPLVPLCFEANKGSSRISVLWFGLLWTYLKLSPTMNADMTSEFVRPYKTPKVTSFQGWKLGPPEGEGFAETIAFAKTSPL